MDERRRINNGRELLAVELEGIEAVRDRLDGAFSQAIDLMHGRRGKLVVVGMGKSGIVGRKFAATLTSTGNPAVFLHPAEGLHGDLGIVQRGDVALVLSNSGSSPEVVELLEALKRLSVPVIALTAVTDSPLGRVAEVVLDVAVPKEACPMGLAPTASTTATLALCDALAVVLLEEAGFTSEDFGHLHPGGALGRRLRRVEDLMHTGADVPTVPQDAPVREALVEMTGKRLGITGVLDGEGRLVGVITDGDLRRALERHRDDLLDRTAGDLMTDAPKTIRPSALAETAIARMDEHRITCLFVSNGDGRPIGAIHLHDLLRGEVR